MKKFFNNILPLLAMILFSTCGFEFSEDYFKDIEIVEPQFSFSLTNFINGEIIKDSKSINFDYQAHDKNQLFEIRFYINDALVETFYQPKGNFILDIQNLENGQFTFKIEYFFKSGTGSLADLNNAEVYTVVENLSFSVDKTLANPFSFTNIAIKDGTIFIHWNDITDRNFNEVYLLIQDGYKLTEVLLNDEILDSKIYNDSLSVSNNISYQIKTLNSFEEKYGEKKELNLEGKFISYLDVTPTKELLLKWNEHPLYANFDKFEFSYAKHIDLNKRGGEFLIPGIIPFGSTQPFIFNIVRNNQYVNYIENIIFLGEKFNLEYINDYLFDSSNNKMFALELKGDNYYQASRKVMIHTLDNDNFSFTNSKEIFSVNDDVGKISSNPINNNIQLDLANLSLELDPLDLTIVNQFYASEYFSNTQNKDLITRHRDGIVIVEEKDIYGKVYFYNAVSKDLIYSGSKRTVFKISENGKYFILENAFYTIQNEKVEKLYELSNTYAEFKDLVFLKDKKQVVLSDAYSNPIIYDINSKTQIIIPDIEKVTSMNYDKTSNKILLFQRHYNVSTTANVYNFETKELTQLYVTRMSYENDGYYFYNNTLISPNGYYLKNYFN